MRNNTHLIAIAITALLLMACRPSEPSQVQDREARRDAILKNIVPPEQPDLAVSIDMYGAVGDSVTDCKPAFDKAMEEAEKNHGACIVVPPGVYYLAGPIHFVSNVTLHLEEGAKLVFSSNPSDYLPVVKTSWEGTFLYNYSPLIYAYQVDNVAITGKGVIDGNGSANFSGWRAIQKESQMLSREMNHKSTPVAERIFGEGHFLRPHLIQFYECRNVLIEDVHITNSPFWCVHLLLSENVTVRGVSFDAQNANNDGIDPEYSKNVLIEDVDFNNADDNVAIKAGRDYEGRAMATPTENIIIRNCRFKGLHAVVIGSEMSSGVRNVFVENCTFAGYCKRGIYLKSNPDRGGFIHDIYVNNVEFGEVLDLFYVTSYYHGQGEGFETDIQRVYVDGLKCRKANNGGIVVQGFPTKKVKDFYFSNVAIDTVAVGVSLNNAENIVLSEINIGGKIMEMPSFAH